MANRIKPASIGDAFNGWRLDFGEQSPSFFLPLKKPAGTSLNCSGTHGCYTSRRYCPFALTMVNREQFINVLSIELARKSYKDLVIAFLAAKSIKP
jgi:hypothetical protein